MTTDELIDGILKREGENGPDYIDPNDSGGRTSWGISERAHPDAWKNGPPTRAAARAIYETLYVAPFISLRGAVVESVRAVVIDDAVLSGRVAAVKRLQHIAGAAEDGILGMKTLNALRVMDQVQLLHRLITDRTVFLVRLAIENPKDLKWLAGWVIRSLSFL